MAPPAHHNQASTSQNLLNRQSIPLIEVLMSPYFLHHADSPGLTLVSQPLTGDNYAS